MAVGDSLTLGAFVSASDTYPAQLATTLGSPWTVENLGQSGQTLSTLTTYGASYTDPHRDPRATKSILAPWIGTNDLGAGVSAASLYTSYVAFCQARKTAGWKVVAFTILPRTNAGDPADFEAQRTAFNALVRANYTAFAHALADVGADATIGVAGAQNNATYYNADKVHLLAAGYTIVKNIVNTAMVSANLASTDWAFQRFMASVMREPAEVTQ